MEAKAIFHQAARWLEHRLSQGSEPESVDAHTERFREGRGTVLTVRCAFCPQVIIAGNSKTVARGICPKCKAKLKNERILDP